MLHVDTYKDEDKIIEDWFTIKRGLVWAGLVLCIILFWVAVFSCFRGCCYADSLVIKQEFVAGYSLDKWADCIRITEGNPNYGILSIDCKLSECRRICKNTVRNNWRRYKRAKGDMTDLDGFIDFIADKYTPKISDPIGNRNWKHNMKSLLRKENH